MDLLIAANSVPLSGADTPPSSGTPQYATDGNPGVTAATTFPAYHYNGMMLELYNAIVASGQTPNRNVLTQLVQAIQIMAVMQPVVLTGSGNWTVPAGVYWIRVRQWAAGGAGGAAAGGVAGGGGGGGGYCEYPVAVTPGALLPYSVGAGGVAGSGAGGNGGDTTFNGVTVHGGAGGAAGSGSGGAGGSGGSASSGSGRINNGGGGQTGDGGTAGGSGGNAGDGGAGGIGGFSSGTPSTAPGAGSAGSISGTPANGNAGQIVIGG